MKNIKLLNRFSQKILAWYDQFGRKNLPWQKEITPYRVWVSEVMLQQTQVETVKRYFVNFMKAFPTVDVLANADEDEVLRYWSGLGYYSRAINLHKTSKIIVHNYVGIFPNTVCELMNFPGIGRSTAGAIVSISMDIKAPILDGNVKRVLARFFEIEGWPGYIEIEKKLWKISNLVTPADRVGDYTQAIMDFGAIFCKRSNPVCNICPLKEDCIAFSKNKQYLYPFPKPKKIKPNHLVNMLLIFNRSGHVFLEKRPNEGVWRSLWSLPELSNFNVKDQHLKLKSLSGKIISEPKKLDLLKHSFTHYKLLIQPYILKISKFNDCFQSRWIDLENINLIAVPAPVKKLLLQMR